MAFPFSFFRGFVKVNKREWSLFRKNLLKMRGEVVIITL